MFIARVQRWWSELIDGLTPVYPDPQALARRCVLLAAAAHAQREEELLQRDAERTVSPDWFQRPDAIGYAAYADRMVESGGLSGVARATEYLRELGVTYLHVMPVLKPRPIPNDGGYAVADHREIRSDLGTMADLRELTTALHEAGISLCLDLVLNHVAREHEWARRAQAGEQKYRDYFYIFADRAEPDAYEATLPAVFPDNAPGNFTWDDTLGGWVWTTFNSYQWDLNWNNPDVFADMLDVMLFLANQGVDVLRLDAIAFLYKRRGTDCQNQPEVHHITQALRAVVRMAATSVAFLAEAGKVADLAYNNSLMVQLWSMIASRDTRLAVQALRAYPPIPATTSWLTYVRCHDDIGWTVEDRDASAVGLSGPEHRAFLSDFYSGLFPGSFAQGLVFQFNPETGDRRISGATASLAGLGSALAAGDACRAKDAVARILLLHAVIMMWGGIPVLWAGDEVATLNDDAWASTPEHSDDNRWVHRPRLDWDLLARVREDAGRLAAQPSRARWVPC